MGGFTADASSDEGYVQDAREYALASFHPGGGLLRILFVFASLCISGNRVRAQ